jgi:hypothetical protein
MNGHHELRALDLVIGGKPKCERKPHRKSVKALLDIAERRKLPVKKLNPDGSVEIGEASEPEQPEELVALEKWKARHGR